MKADITLGLSRREAEILEDLLRDAATEREEGYPSPFKTRPPTLRALDVEPIHRRLAMLLHNPAA